MIDAKSLLGTAYLPSGFQNVQTLARVARAYDALVPYPNFSNLTKDWKTEDRGPYPRCRPFVQHIVSKGVSWLFGRPISFRANDEGGGENKDLSEQVNDIWTGNDMNRRSLTLARTGALSGGCVMKFSFREDTGVHIDLLDPTQQCRLYWDPFNLSRLLMARIQFPYYNAVEGKMYYWREDWTDEDQIIYKPVPMATFGTEVVQDAYNVIDKVDAYGNWEKESEKRNPFGIIPLWYVRNKETGTEYGEGDLWTMYTVVDQINFTRDLEHKGNQKAIDPKLAYIDVVAPNEEQAMADGPSSVEVLQTADGAQSQGKVEKLDVNAAVRPYVAEFADDLMRELYAAVGVVDLKPEEVTNKGNLTAAVMMQMYEPLVTTTAAKRTCYGEDGIAVFFERMAFGLTNLGVQGWRPEIDVQVIWPPYFEQTEEEKTAAVSRQALMIENDFTTHDRAVREVAKMDGVIDADDLLSKVQAEKSEREAKEAAESRSQPDEFERARRGLGG